MTGPGEISFSVGTQRLSGAPSVSGWVPNWFVEITVRARDAIDDLVAGEVAEEVEYAFVVLVDGDHEPDRTAEVGLLCTELIVDLNDGAVESEAHDVGIHSEVIKRPRALGPCGHRRSQQPGRRDPD